MANAKFPNAHLKRRSNCCWPTSQVSLQDANLLKIEVTYGYRLERPDQPRIAAAMQVADPANALYYQADPIRLPIQIDRFGENAVTGTAECGECFGCR